MITNIKIAKRIIYSLIVVIIILIIFLIKVVPSPTRGGPLFNNPVDDGTARILIGDYRKNLYGQTHTLGILYDASAITTYLDKGGAF